MYVLNSANGSYLFILFFIILFTYIVALLVTKYNTRKIYLQKWPGINDAIGGILKVNSIPSDHDGSEMGAQWDKMEVSNFRL